MSVYSRLARRWGNGWRIKHTSSTPEKVDRSDITTHRSRPMDYHRQNYPNCVYPRLESVDLQDEGPTRKSPTPSEDLMLKSLDFGNHSQAFRNKTTWEMIRALGVLRLCSFETLSDNSFQMMTLGRRIGGRCFLRAFLKPTFYNQFVGGETTQEIRACVRRLAETGTRAILASTLEEDVGEGGKEEVYDANFARIMECLEIATAEDTPSPMIQLKMSGLLPADLLQVIVGCLYKESGFKLKLIDTIAAGMSGDAIEMEPFATVLDDKEKAILHRAVKRLKKIGEGAKAKGVKILVDAEYTYLNPGLSFLTMAMVQAFNDSSPVVWNTYQCYLKNAMFKVDEELHLSSEMRRCFGAKVVRGAYVLQERLRAQKLRISDPICDDYHATSANYNKIVSHLLERCHEMGSKCALIIASHNEESIRLCIEKMKDLGLDVHHGGVSFGQLYGMCDQITNPLASSGYAVYKSIPYGTMEEVLPYLARRAVENKSIVQGARKERELLWKEIKCRISQKVRCRSSV